MEIPLNLRYHTKDEAEAAASVVQSGNWASNGPVCRFVEQQISQQIDDAHVMLTSSGETALELALLVLGIGRNDEVILSTFASPMLGNAILRSGARPVFADIRPDTLCIDAAEIGRNISDSTKAIIVTHYAGIACDMPAILEIAAANGLFVIEDASLAFGASLNDKPLGTFGHIGCFSFDENSTISCGEGGAFVTSSDILAQNARLMHRSSEVTDPEIDAFNWQTVGGNFALSDVLAAVLETQLEKRLDIKSKRRQLWQEYHDALEVLAVNGHIILPDIPSDVESNYALFYFRTNDEATRNLILTQLRGRGIHASGHFRPLHSTSLGEQFARASLPIAEARAKTLVRLPLYPDLSPRAARIIVRTIEKLFAPTQKDYDSLQSTAVYLTNPGVATG